MIAKVYSSHGVEQVVSGRRVRISAGRHEPEGFVAHESYEFDTSFPERVASTLASALRQSISRGESRSHQWPYEAARAASRERLVRVQYVAPGAS